MGLCLDGCVEFGGEVRGRSTAFIEQSVRFGHSTVRVLGPDNILGREPHTDCTEEHVHVRTPFS